MRFKNALAGAFRVNLGEAGAQGIDDGLAYFLQHIKVERMTPYLFGAASLEMLRSLL